jgi:hypothetical protein
MKKVFDYIKKLIDDSDITVSLRALSVLVGLFLIITIVGVSLYTGKTFDSTTFIALLGFIATCLGLSLSSLNK